MRNTTESPQTEDSGACLIIITITSITIVSTIVHVHVPDSSSGEVCELPAGLASGYE